MKRAANEKDSGTLMPGHGLFLIKNSLIGGILDRIDSLCLTTYVMYFYLAVVVGFDNLHVNN